MSYFRNYKFSVVENRDTKDLLEIIDLVLAKLKEKGLNLEYRGD